MADAAGEYEEVEDGVHVLALVQRVEDGAGDVADALGDDPRERGRRDAAHRHVGLGSDRYDNASCDAPQRRNSQLREPS